MNMKKKLLLLSLCICMALLMSFSVLAVHTGIEDTDEAEKLQVIQLLEVMNGDQFGNLNLDSTVTRAEFVKMVINASVYKDSVTNSGVSVFPDVKSDHWAAPYIALAVKNGYINGYLDGTFRPDNDVKLEEAVMVLLKMLGYTSADFYGTYPDTQLAKYEEIDLDTDIDAVKGQVLTRRECMKLIYNLLCTKTKSGTIYCQSALGYAADADSETIDLDLLLEDKMAGPYINTAENPWTANVSFAGNPNTTYYLNGKRTDYVEADDYDVYYYSEKARTIWFYNRKEFGKISSISPNKVSPESFLIQNSGTVFILTDYSKNRFRNLGLDVDDYVMMIFDKNDKVADIMLVDHELYSKFADDNLDLLDEVNKSLSKPIIVTDMSYADKIPLNLDEALIICDGTVLSKSDIALGDVLYYSSLANSVWVYREKVSGMYTAVAPSRENPVSVTVANKLYTLGTDDAKYKFSSYGTFKTGTVVTLILGKGDEVVDVKEADDSSFGDDDNQISYIDAVNATLEGPIVVKDSSYVSRIPLDLDTAQIICDGESITKNDIKTDDVLYYSESLDSVWVFRETESGVCTAILPNKENPAQVMIGSSAYSISTKEAAFKFSGYGTIKTDTLVTLLLGKDGSVVDAKTADMSVIGDGEDQVPYSEVVNYTLKGPFVVKEDGKLLSDTGIKLENAILYKENREVTGSDIKKYNVYYYSSLLNTVWLYDDTKSGTLEAISPSKVSPTSITLSGNVYSLESAGAKYDFSSLGSFKVGDTVTLLLGKDGGVAGVVNITDTEPKVVYGIVLSNKDKTYTDADGNMYVQNTLNVFTTEGTTESYQTNQKIPVGIAVKVVVGEENINVSTLSKPQKQSQATSAIEAIRNGHFDSSVEIIEYYDEELYSTVARSRISGTVLTYDDILYFELNENGDIKRLILDNYTGDLFKYGLLLADTQKVEINSVEMSVDTDFRYMIDSNIETRVTSLVGNIKGKQGPSRFEIVNGIVHNIESLKKSVYVKNVVGNKLYDQNDKEYIISESAKVFVYENGKYSVYDPNVLQTGEYQMSYGYYDKESEYGGRIRVIIANK